MLDVGYNPHPPGNAVHIVHGRAEVYDILTKPNGMLESITRVLQHLCNRLADKYEYSRSNLAISLK